MGPNRERDYLGIVRLGGHVESGETSADCAVREIGEEAGLKARLVPAPVTFTYPASAMPDWDPGKPDRVEVSLGPSTRITPQPLLIGAGRGSGDSVSVTYWAEAEGSPSPGAETRGLLLLDAEQIMAAVQVNSLLHLMDRGARSWLTEEFPSSLPMRPHAPLRVLADLLRRYGPESLYPIR